MRSFLRSPRRGCLTLIVKKKEAIIRDYDLAQRKELSNTEVRDERRGRVQDYFPIYPGHILGLSTSPKSLDHQADEILRPFSIVNG